jgi:hypothetical protein
MADALQLFDARRSPWTNPDRTLSREAQFFIRELWLRVGGALGPSTNDLATAAFEDAGIAEQLGMIYLLGDAGRQNPPLPPIEFAGDQSPPAAQMFERIRSIETQIAELSAVVDGLRKSIAGLYQGASA